MVRTNGHGDFESQRITHIHVTSNVVVAWCSNSLTSLTVGFLRGQKQLNLDHLIKGIMRQLPRKAID